MAIVVIGGQTRNVGKTSVVAGIIQALPEMEWTATKITQDEHDICSTKNCDCDSDDHRWSVTEEIDRRGKSDTSRFLMADAKKVFWARIRPGYLADAMPRIHQIIAESKNVIFESNSLIKFLRPDLYIPVLNFESADFKHSAREFFSRADAVIVHANQTGKASWGSVLENLLSDKPRFEINPPQYVTSEIVRFVQEHLSRRPILASRLPSF